MRAADGKMPNIIIYVGRGIIAERKLQLKETSQIACDDEYGQLPYLGGNWRKPVHGRDKGSDHKQSKMGPNSASAITTTIILK